MMARIDAALLAAQAAVVADRANFVRKDPAVVKAAKQAAADVRQSLRSISELTAEASAAWQRSARTR